MESKKEVKKAQEELDTAMIDLLKGMTADLKAPKENYELKFLEDRVLVLETKLDTIMKILLRWE